MPTNRFMSVHKWPECKVMYATYKKWGTYHVIVVDPETHAILAASVEQGNTETNPLHVPVCTELYEDEMAHPGNWEIA